MKLKRRTKVLKMERITACNAPLEFMAQQNPILALVNFIKTNASSSVSEPVSKKLIFIELLLVEIRKSNQETAHIYNNSLLLFIVITCF